MQNYKNDISLNVSNYGQIDKYIYNLILLNNFIVWFKVSASKKIWWQLLNIKSPCSLRFQKSERNKGSLIFKDSAYVTIPLK